MSTLTRGPRPSLPHHAPRPTRRPPSTASRTSRQPMTDARMIARILDLLAQVVEAPLSTIEVRCGLGHYRRELPGLVEALVEAGTLDAWEKRGGCRKPVTFYRLAPAPTRGGDL